VLPTTCTKSLERERFRVTSASQVEAWIIPVLHGDPGIQAQAVCKLMLLGKEAEAAPLHT
jgi:hypothetical protein